MPNNEDIVRYNQQHHAIAVLQRRLIMLSVAIFFLSCLASIIAVLDIEISHSNWKFLLVKHPNNAKLAYFKIYHAASCFTPEHLREAWDEYVDSLPTNVGMNTGSNVTDSAADSAAESTARGRLNQQIDQIIDNYEPLTEEAKRSSWIFLLLKVLLTIISLINVALLAVYHKSHLLLYMKTGVFTTSTIFLAKGFTVALIECIVMSIHIPPLFDCHVKPEYQLIVLIRLIQITKLLKQNSRIQQRVVSKMLGGLASLQKISTLRVYLLSHPWTCLIGAYFFSTFVLGYVTFVIERAVSEQTDPATQNYQDYLSTLWMMFVTITSLGFGDVVPKSNFGRLIITLVSVGGVLLAGVFISTTQQFLQIPDKEKRLFETMKLTQLCKDRIVCAARTILEGILITIFSHFCHYVSLPLTVVHCSGVA